MSVTLITPNVSKLKAVFDSLMAFATDVNLTFSRDNDANAGMSIYYVHSNIALTYFNMKASEINKYGAYRCSEPCFIGINVGDFFKLLKRIGNNDTITILVDPKLPTKMLLKYENAERERIGVYELDSLDINAEEFEIPTNIGQYEITMDSAELHHMFCDANAVCCDVIQISSTGEKLIIRAFGETANLVLSLHEHVSTKCEMEEVSNYYPLKFLLCFTKYYKFSSRVTLSIKRDFPLGIKYQIENIGEMMYYLMSTDPPEDVQRCTTLYENEPYSEIVQRCTTLYDTSSCSSAAGGVEKVAKKRGRKPNIDKKTLPPSPPNVVISKRSKIEISKISLNE